MKKYLYIILFLYSFKCFSQEFVIYGVTQNFPMGTKEDIKIKNYFVTIGKNQGIEKGTVLDVFRLVSIANPLESGKRYDHKVKIGELEVIHSENESSITKVKELSFNTAAPVIEIDNLVIGDQVDIHLNN